MKTLRFVLASLSAILAVRLLGAPTINSKPASVTVASGGNASFSVTATGTGTVTYQWQCNGSDVAGATADTLSLTSVTPDNAGIYRVVATDATGSTTSYPAVLGVTTTNKVIGGGTEVGSDILDPNGNVYDQVLLTSAAAATVTADAGQITKVSFIDAANDDLVTVEFAGAGSLTVLLEGATGPAAPVKYNQPSISYMKGTARLVIAGADQTTNVSVYSIGTANASNQSIFIAGTSYDGVADIASVAILGNGQFGGLRLSNARLSAAKGLVGVYAPGVAFSGPVYVQDIDATAAGMAVFVLGSSNDTRVIGGDLQQHPGTGNPGFVFSNGFTTPLVFAAGVNSHGVNLPALSNLGTLVPYGVTATATQQASFGIGTGVLAGSVVDLQLFINASVGPVSVQWQKNGSNLGSPVTPDAAGIAHYFILGAQPADAGPYTAVVTDNTGTSAPVTVNQAQFVIPRPTWQWRHPYPNSQNLVNVVPKPDGGFFLFGNRGYVGEVSVEQNQAGSSLKTVASLPFTTNTMGGYRFGNGRHVFWATSGQFTSAEANGANLAQAYIPGGEFPTEMVFGEGRFVAVCQSGRIYTSANGTAWTVNPTSVSEQIVELTYGVVNGTPLFLAATASGKLLQSADGLAWTGPTAGPTTSVSMLRFAKDRFFLGTSSGALHSSTDGANWTARSSGTSNQINDLAYGADATGDHFVLVANGGVVRTSGTGDNFTAGTIQNNQNVHLQAVAFANGAFVATGSGNGGVVPNALLLSVDGGANWSRQEGWATTGATMNGIAANNTGNAATQSMVFVGNTSFLDAVGASHATIVRSVDGWDWKRINTGSTGTSAQNLPNTNLTDVAWFGGATGAGYYAVGTVVSGVSTVIYSADGVTWGQLTTGFGNNLSWVGTLKDTLYISGGTGRLASYSGTGTTATSWTSVTTGTTSTIFGAAYGSIGGVDTYVIVGANGMIRTSTGGTANWVAATGIPNVNYNEVAFANGVFIAVGNGGTILRSTDGTTWTNQSFGLPENFTDVSFVGAPSNIFVVAGSGSGTFVSPDGLSWQLKLAPIGTSQALRSTATLAGRVYGVGGGSSVVAADLDPQIENVTVKADVVAGNAATFRVDYFDPLIPVTLQWTRGNLPIPGATGATYTIPNASRADAGLYTVRMHTAVDDNWSDFVALDVAPTQYPGVLAPDPAYNPNPLTLSTRIYATLSLADGKWLVGGEFVRWENKPRAGLVRLNADYSVDDTFTPPLLNGFVLALAQDSNGAVYVGGDFTAADGHLRNGILRLQPGTLALDLGWTAKDGAPLSQVSALATRDTQVYVARNSGGSGAITGTNVVRRLNADGGQDAQFSVDIALASGRILDLVPEPSPSTSLVIGGSFATVAGTNRNGIVRVGDTGTVDSAFGGTSGANGQVSQTKRLSDGRYLLGGTFTTIAGQTRNRIAILTSAGAADTFAPPAFNSGVTGVTALSDGKIFATGAFTTVGGQTTAGLVRLTTAGVVDKLYVPTGTVLGIPANGAGRNMNLFPLAGDDVALFGAFQSVLNQRRVGVAVVKNDGTLASTPATLAYRPAYAGSAFVEKDGKLTLFGSIDVVGSTTGLGQTIRLNDNGTLASGYPVGAGFTMDNLSTFGVYRAIRQGDGKTIAVGDFTAYNGTPVARLGRLNGDGTLDGTFNPGTGPTLIFPPLSPVMDGGGALLGNFANQAYNGTTITQPYLKVNDNGARDTAFALGAFAGGNPNFAWTENGNVDGLIVITGAFTSYGGASVPGMVAVDYTGARRTDVSFGSGVSPAGTVAGIVRRGMQGAYMFGNFTSFNGVTVNRLFLYDGGQANLVSPNFTAPAAINGPVGQVLVQEDGRLIVVGDFTTTINGQTVPNPVIRLRADGSVDNNFALRGITSILAGTGASLRVAMADDGGLYLYGTPFSLNYGAPQAVARFRGTAPLSPAIATQPSSSTALPGGSVTLAVKVNGTAPFSYQWRKNGVNITDATSSTYTLDNVQGADAASYDVVITNGVGGGVTSSPARVVVQAATNDAFPNFAWRNPTPAGGSLSALVYAAGRFVAGGIGGRILTSTDGDTWSSAAVLATESVNSLVFSSTDNQFVAVGGSGKVFTSTNLTSWTQRFTAPNWLNGVAYANGVYVAAGFNSTIVSSTDGGATWAARTSPVAGKVLRNVAATTGHYVIGGFQALLHSTDGTTWADVLPAANASQEIRGIAFLNGQFIAVGSNGLVLSSTTGTTWTSHNTGFTDWLENVTWDGTNYIIATSGAAALRSTDFVNWTRVPINTLAQYTQLVALAGPAGNVIAVGPGAEIWKTTDGGATWASRGAQGGLWQFNELRYLNGRFVAVGAAGNVFTSTDGVNWKLGRIPDGNWNNAVAYGAGQYVIGASSGEFYTSHDATSWFKHGTADFVANRGLAYAAISGGLWVAVGDNGTVRTSADAFTWTTLNSAVTGITANLNSVEARGSLLVAVGTNGAIYTSTNGTSWTACSSGTTEALQRVRLIDGTFFVLGTNRTVLVSADGASWVPAPMPNDYGNFGYDNRDIARLHDGYYVVGSQGQVSRTTDFTTWTKVGPLAFGENLSGLAVGAGKAVFGGGGGTLLETALPAPQALPTIAAMPRSHLFATNGSAVLSVVANGAGPLGYQWFKDNTAISGATSATLVLTGLQASQAGSYTVKVTGPTGASTTSRAAMLTAATAPTIAQQPANATVVIGGTVTLSVTPSGVGPFTYQWRFNGSTLAGETNQSLTLRNLQAANLGGYSVIVANEIGAVTSNSGSVATGPTNSAFVNDAAFTRPQFQHGTRPGRVTFGAASGKLYASWVNGSSITGAAGDRTGAVMRLNASGAYDDTFKTNAFLSDAWATVEQPDGKVLVGGLASFENDATGAKNYRVWRFTSTGAVDPTYVSPVFVSLPRYIALQGDGKLLVGLASNAELNGGVSSPLTRLNADGTRDLTFNEPVLAGGGGSAGFVFANIVLDAAGKIYIAGTFTSVNGTARPGVARLNSDGTLDSTYVPGGFTFNGSQVRGLGLQKLGANAGKLLVASGSLTASAAARPVIRLGPTGTLDPSFTLLQNSDVGVSPGATRPRLLGVLPDDRFLIVSTSVRRLEANGALDATYTAPAFSAEAFWMEPLADGSVVVPLDFGATVNGAAAGALAKFLPAGGGDTSFTAPSFNTEIYPNDAAILPDGKILTWGRFDTVNATARGGVARFNVDGTLDTSFTPPGNVYGVSAAAPQADGGVLVATLTGVSPNALSAGLVRLTSAGATDSAFTADTAIAAAAAGGDFGMFAQADGRTIVWSQNPQRVLNGESFVKRINANGSLDATFTGPGTVFGSTFRDGTGAVTSIVLGSFRVLAQYADGRILATASTGPFTANATSIDYRLVRLTASGAVDATFTSPTVAATLSSGFTSVITDAQTNTTTQFALKSGENPFVGAVLQADGSVVVFGSFASLGGSSAGIARLTSSGAYDSSFNVGTGPELRSQPGRSAGIGGVAVASDGRYWLGGTFDTFNGRAVPGLVRLTNTGAVDTNFGSAVAFQPYLGTGGKILLRTDTEALIVGTFARGTDAFPVALNRILAPTPPAISAQPIAAQIVPAGASVTLSAGVQGAPYPALTWSRNGTAVGSTATLGLANVTTANAGVYSLAAQNASGSTTSKNSLLTVVAPGGDTFPQFAWRNPLPAGGTLRAVAYGSGQFVAVGQGGRIFTWDGAAASWNTVTPVTSIVLNAVTYVSSLNRWVAVGASGDIYLSSVGNATVWTKQATSPASSDAYNGVSVGTVGGTTVIVAVGQNGRISTSSNGTAWATQQISGSPQFNAVAGAADLFAAVGSNGVIYTSTNGTTWATAAAPAGLATTSFLGVRYLNGKFVGVGNSGAIIKWTGVATDSWTKDTTPSQIGLRDIALVGTTTPTYVAVADDGRLFRSTDFTTWTAGSVPTFSLLFSAAADPGGNTLVSVGAGGEIWKTTDGSAWSNLNGVFGGFARMSAVEYLNNQFVAVGANGAIYVSADAEAWQRTSSNNGSYLDNVTFGAGLYAIATDSGDVLTSPDAKTWTQRAVGDTTNNNGIAYDGSRFVAVGNGGKVRTSTDGITWTSGNIAGVTGNLLSVVAKPGLFTAVGDSGKIFTSTDGANWTDRTPATSTQRLNRVRVIDGTYFAVGDSRTLLISTDSLTWFQIALAPSFAFSFRDIARLTDGYYIVADQGALIRTTDLKAATLAGTLASSETLHMLAVGAGKVVIAGDGGTLLKSNLPAGSATPAIAFSPADVTTDATRTLVLTVQASASGPLTFKWQRNGVDIAGQTSAVLVLPNLATTDSGAYRAIVTSGANATPSNAANVTVNAIAKPQIQLLPVAAQATTGPATFTVAATGTAPLSYQWYKGSSGDTSTPVGTNSATFQTAALGNASERYWVKVTNLVGDTLNSPTTTAVALTPRNGALAAAAVTGFASNGTVIVAVAGPAILAYDTSATTPQWTLVSALTGNFLRAVAYAGGKFVAVGDGGVCRTSTNGTSWSAPGNAGTSNLNGLCHDGTQFVAVGASGAIVTSTDGSAWTTTHAALPGGLTMRGIVFIPSVGYVAVGGSTSGGTGTGTLLTSNGRYAGTTAPAWTARTTAANVSATELLGVAIDDATVPRIMVVGRGGLVRTSTDSGATWASSTTPTTGDLLGVGYGGGAFLVAANGANILTTNFGTSWSAAVSALPTNNAGTNSVFYTGSRFLVGGSPGLVFSSTNGAQNTWTLETGFTSTGFNDVLFGGGAYVAVGNSGQVARSVDGRSYTAPSPATPGVAALRRVAFGKGTYVAVGDSGLIMTSADGLQWTSRSVGASGFSAVGYGSGKFVAVVNTAPATYYTSPDGEAWTQAAVSLAPSAVNHLSFANGLFVAAGNNGVLATSPDGVTWTTRTTGTTAALNYGTFGAGKFVVVGSSSTVLTSADGVTWTARTLGTTGANLTGIAYGDGMFLATHNNNGGAIAINGSAIFASLDGVTWNITTLSGGLLNQFNQNTVAFGNGAFLFAAASAQLTQSLPAADAPRITTPPATQNVASGQSVNLTVAAAGSSPSYQWYEGVSGDTSVPVGGNSATFATPSLLQSKRYWVRVTAGGTSIDSATAFLLGGPTIVTAPTSRIVNDGSATTLTVNAFGAAPLSYVWKFNGATVGTGPSYTINPVSLASAGGYTVTVSNGAGSVTSSTATLSVTPVSPTLGTIASTYGRNIPVGANTELSIPVTATPPLTYEWRLNGTAIAGATKPGYFITNATPAHAGTYSVRVINAQGAAVSANFGLGVSPELGWQWRNPLPTGNGLSTVHYINNRFYVGGLRSTLLVSDDGATWTPRAVPGTGNIFDLTYGNGRYVALGGLDAIFTSEDGNVWTARDSKIQDSNQLQSVAFGAGRFVAVGFDGHTTTSTDGITWTPGQVSTSVANDYLQFVHFLNGKFWVASTDESTWRLWQSTDGLTWTQPALTLPANQYLTNVAYGGNVYAAIGNNAALWSADGITWSLATGVTLNAGSEVNSLRYVNNAFVLLGSGGEIFTSTDAQTWSARTSGVTAGLAAAAYGQVGAAQDVYVIAGTGGRTLLRSTDLATWTNVAFAAAGGSQFNAVATGNGKLVAVGNSGAIITSADGLAWTAQNSGVSTNLNDVTYAGGVFVAVGANGRVLTAADSDLTTWAARTSNTTTNLRRVTFAGGQFVAVSDGGSTITSPDGTTWTVRSSGTGLQLFGVAYNGALHVAVGNNGGLFSSADSGVTWTVRSTGVATTGYSDVLFAAGKFVAVGVGGVAATSADGLTWSQVPSFTTDDLNGLAFAGGQWIVCGRGSTYYTSIDGVAWTPRYTGAFDRMRDVVPYGSNQVIGVGSNALVLAAGAPTLVAPPQNVVARAGATTTLTALAGGAVTGVTYQWRKDGQPLANGAGIAGANTPTLTLSSITTAAQGSYTLAASNSFGSVTSAAAALTVSQAPTFTQQPANVVATAGQQVIFTAVAAGNPAPTYQWRKDNTPLANGSGIAGTTSSTLTLTNVQPGAAGSYTVTATNTPQGETNPVSEQSLPATLTVNVPPTATIAAATPAIAAGKVTVTAGGNVTFNATAAGTAPLSYRWRLNGLNLGDGPNITGATTDTLSLAGVPLTAAGEITVAVTNVTGTIVSAAVTLAVDPPAPVILSPLATVGVINAPFQYATLINQTTATFAATNLPPGLSINAATGVISGTPTQTGVFNTVSLTATNASGADAKTLALTINPPPPVITSAASVVGRAGQPLSYTITATNSPGSVGASGLPAWLTRTGNVLSGTPPQVGAFAIVVSAANATGSTSITVNFTINAPLNAPVYAGQTQPSGTQNAAFTFTPTFTNPVNAANGYAITGGTLPAGLSLNANTGVISGTPTAVGSFVVTLTATGSGGSTNVTLTFVINPAPTAPVITSPATAAGTKGDVFVFALATDVAATSFSATGLPALGLSLDPATGVISGTPSAPGTLQLSVSATSGALTGPSAVLVITISPSPLAPVITSSPVVSTGRVAVATTLGAPLYQILATNTPNAYEQTAGPDLATLGLALDLSTGAIYGQPNAAGTYAVWLAASNTVGGRGPSLEVTFVIQPAANVPVITSNGTAAGQVGQPFSYVIAATGAPSSYGATGLPGWLAQTGTTNLLSGIPTAATTDPIAILVTATNGGGTSAPKPVSITIAPAPATPIITSAGTASARVGQGFSFQMTATASPTSFNAMGLPPGLLLDPSTGRITGTPTQADSFTVTLSAANAAGVGVTSPLVISIAPAPLAPAVTSAGSVTGKVGVAFSYAIGASNGPITSYGVNGTLPLGLSLNTTTGVISGTPAAPGLLTVDLTATSANGTSLPQQLIVVIDPADNVPVITSPLYAIGTVGSAFSYQIQATNMPGSTPFQAPIILDAVRLPAGLAVNPSTGLIVGTPSVAGTFTASLVGTNAAGTGPLRDLILFIQPAATAPVVTSVTTAAGQVNLPFSYQITATNNPFAFEILGAQPWMTINGQSGAVGGTPTAPGTFVVQMRALNSAGASNPVTLTLAIAPAANTPIITSTRAASGRVTEAFSYTITATGSPTSYVATGLPPGLSIDGATGAISGTPTSSGQFIVAISANNTNGAGQSVPLTLTFAEAFQVTIGH